MTAAPQHCIAVTTCGTELEAESLAGAILDARLGACVQIAAIVSHYTWQGTRSRDAEWRLTVKTRTTLAQRLGRFIQEHHSYDVPEYVVTPIVDGSPAYLRWVDASTDPA